MGTMLHEEYKHMKDLQSKVRYIRDELRSMRAFLRYAEAKQDAGLLDEEQKVWFKQVLEVAYDSEDVVDEFLLRFAIKNEAGFHGNVRQMYTVVKNLPSRHRISSKISDIKIRVQEISTRHQKYRSSEGITETSSNRSSEIPIRGHALLLSEEDLVGIDRPRREIVSLILTDESHRKAISVWGMGGLGKTTLVKRVYEEVKGQFTINAWMTISQTFAIHDAFRNLIHQLFKKVNQPIPTHLDKMNADELRYVVKDFLTGKKYIIVLDDLWEPDHWYSIKYVFPNDVLGSRIIITTRKEDVANTCRHEFNGNVHKMQPLSPDDSWQLFCKMTFQDGVCHENLVNISQNILNKCGGLPLGIVAIGSLLAIKDTREWEIVLRSLGGYLERSGNLNPVILLSYNDLPYHLKCCLLYMGVFPEDAAVTTKVLLDLWMAEGFVEVIQGMTTIEVARSYLNDLVGRSLVHVVYADTAGNIKKCRVHDLTYEIIQSKCKEYNIFTRNSVQLGSVRRLVVYDYDFFPNDPANLLHLRSIIASNISESCLSKLLRPSKLLKVLHLKHYYINIIPDEVFRLSNLTYLNISAPFGTNISKGIRHLQNLEYLLLYVSGVTELPDDIVKLKKLYYLGIFGRQGFKAPRGFGALVSLHYLEGIEADSENVIHEIGKLTQLRSLGITKFTRENGKALCSTLEKLTNLQKLDIHIGVQNEIMDVDYSLDINLQFLSELGFWGRLVKIPNWVPYCHSLTTLILYHTCLSENPLGYLEGMPNLVDLHLVRAYRGDTLNFKEGGFQNLKSLGLKYLSKLRFLRFEKGTLPELETLVIENCQRIEELPQDIQHLKKLQTLDLFRMPKSLGDGLRNLKKESEGYRKIAHIRNIKIHGYIGGKRGIEYLKW